jgi:hypothetical protein
MNDGPDGLSVCFGIVIGFLCLGLPCGCGSGMSISHSEAIKAGVA